MQLYALNKPSGLSGVFPLRSIIAAVFAKTLLHFCGISLIVCFYILIDEAVVDTKIIILSLVGIILGRILLTLIVIKAEKNIREVISRWFLEILLRVSAKKEKKALILEAAAKSLPICLENYSGIFDVFYYALTLIVSLVLCGFFFREFEASAVFFISLFLLGLISHLIARRTSFHTKNFMDIIHKRVEKALKWIQFRAYIQNWGLMEEALGQMRNILNEEEKHRNWDSFWKSLDNYLIVFCGLLPLMTAQFLGYQFQESFKGLLIFWIAIPTMGLFLQMARFPSLYVQCCEIFHELNSLNTKDNDEVDKEIILDKSWDIWSGTIAENIACLSMDCTSYFNELRLNKDLGITSPDGFILQSKGKNISAGQKDRILLLRALNLCKMTGLDLVINLDFSTLDHDALKRVVSLLERESERIHIKNLKALKDICDRRNAVTPEDHPSFQRKLPSYLQEEKEEDQNNHSYTSLLYSLKPFFILLFCIPAISAVIIPNALKDVGLLSSIQLLGITFWGGISLWIAIMVGFFLEKNLRSQATSWALNIIKKASFENESDIYQRLTRDLNVYMERIVWYTHDICWYISNILINIVLIGFTKNIWVVLSFMVLSAFATIIWKLYAKKIKRAQNNCIKQHHNLLNNLEKFISRGRISNLGHIWNKMDVEIKESLFLYLQENIKLFRFKTVSILYSKLATGAFIIACVCFFIYYPISSNLYAAILTSLLFVDRFVTSLFQALTGYNANCSSHERLLKFPVGKDSFPPPIFNEKSQLFIPSISLEFIKKYTKKLTLNSENIYNLVGMSGEGKTLYLKTIVGFPSSNQIMRENSSAVYIDHQYKNILSFVGKEKNLEETFNLFKEKKLLIYDEVFAHMSLIEWEESMYKLSNFLKNEGKPCIVTDHVHPGEIILELKKIIKGDLNGIFVPRTSVLDGVI